MRENTGSRTVATINFVNGQASVEAVWTPKQAGEAEWIVDDMATAHLETAADFNEAGEVWFYDFPGLAVWALVTGGVVDTVVYASEDDMLRVTTAIRTGREMSIRYVKPTGEVSRRRVRPQSLYRTQGGDYIVRAEDDRRDGDVRSFRFDRVTHTTLHRRVRKAAPTKAALVAQAQTAPVTGPVRHTRHGFTGTVVEGTRAFGPSGWSVIVKLDDPSLAAGGTTRASEGELEVCTTMEVQNWDGSPETIGRDAYDRLMSARDPREPRARDERTSWIVSETDVYSTAPGTAVALDAPENVQDVLAERYALGHPYAFIAI